MNKPFLFKIPIFKVNQATQSDVCNSFVPVEIRILW